MDCKKVMEELVFLLTEEMGHDVRVEFSDHVDHCPHCAARARSFRVFLITFRQRTVRCPAPTHLRERILAIMPHRRVVPR